MPLPTLGVLVVDQVVGKLGAALADGHLALVAALDLAGDGCAVTAGAAAAGVLEDLIVTVAAAVDFLVEFAHDGGGGGDCLGF